MVRIGCLQFSPQVGDIDNNLNRADSLLNRADPMDLDGLDLLVLPEMAFSGYNFKSLQQIMPYLEPSGSGISSLWARTTALKYDCLVAVGYPEKVDVSGKWPATPEYYNSLIMVNGNGETIANYRKSFLYYTDETWALEGGGFFEGEIDTLGQVAMGICMDINPYKFQTPWNTFEFAVHVLEVKANLVILSMAWLTQEDSTTFTPLTEEPDMETLSYWIQRLEPIIRKESEEEIIVVFCNRCGMEAETTYAGTSAVIGIKNGEVSVYGLMGRGVKEIMVVNTELPPFAKLINRPDETEAVSEAVASPQQPQQQLSGEPSPVFIPKEDPVAESPQDSLPIHSPPSPSERSEITAVHVGPDVEMVGSEFGKAGPEFDQSSSECGDDPIPRGGTPMVFPSPAPQCEMIEECATDEDEECSSDSNSECESIRGNETPTYPSPTPMSARPKLEISTAPEALSPARKQPPGISNFFTSYDLPISPLAEEPQSALPKAAPYWGPHSAVGEDTNWSPLLSGSTMAYRSPWDTELRSIARSPASRPASRTTRKVPSPAISPRDVRPPPIRTYAEPPRSPPPLSPRSPTSNFSRPFKAIDNFSVSQVMDLPANSIPIVASPSVFQTTFPRSASAFQEHFASLNQAASEDTVISTLGRRGRSKSVSALSPLFKTPSEDTVPQIPDFPRPPSRATHKERARRSSTKTPPPLSAGIRKHLAQSPTQVQFPVEPQSPQVPTESPKRGRSYGSRVFGRRRASISPEPYQLPSQSPVELRSPIWT